MEVVDETEALQRFFEGERPWGWLGDQPPTVGYASRSPRGQDSHGIPTMQGPPEGLLWVGTLLQIGNREVNSFEFGSLQEVSAHARWTWASRLPSILSFFRGGLPSVLNPPWRL